MVDIRDKTDHGNGQPDYGQQHINESFGTDVGVDPSGSGDLSPPVPLVGLSGTLGVGIKEYMNVPWMPLVDVDQAAEPAGNSLDPSADRREQSGRGFTASGPGGASGGGGGGGRAGGNRTSAANSTIAPVDDDDDDQFPYDEPTAAVGGGDGTAAKGGNSTGEIREPVLRPKSRFRMYRMPDGSNNGSSYSSPQQQQQSSYSAAAMTTANGTAAAAAAGSTAAASSTVTATAERSSFIVHLLPQKLMNMIEQAEKYARMAFSPFMWPTKERTQRALKNFPR